MTTSFDSSVIKVISFNLKRDASIGKSNKWADRKDIAAEVIKNSGAAIIGVQELLPTMKSDFKNIFKNQFTIIGEGRYGGNKPSNDEHSDIIFKNDKVEVMEYKTFWLSKKPEKQCSRGTFAVFPRICTVAEVLIKDTNQKIRVFNTHFDHISWIARKLGVKIILDYMNRFNNIEPLPTILMGDLNCKPDSKAAKILRYNLHDYKSIHLNDVYTQCDESTICNTFHNFKGTQNHKKKPIDYMFVSDDFEIEKTYISTEDYNGQYPSDHYPLVALLKLKTAMA